MEKKISNTTAFALPLIISSAYYKIPDQLEFSENVDTYEKLRIKKEPSVSVIKLPLSLFLLSIILVGILLPCTKMNKIDPEYIKKIRKRRDIFFF
ncbi:hypothetical protein [Methanosarcina horonobensis]|uniref:hypothetical protein n=1 Tax=Methanosarcina horonobensis TaxID=418008 RepID=UPI000B1409B2|nr:hypothetical protein [Methanosarcina horonobensis]